MADIALIGYGKMGRLVEQLAPQRGHRVVAIVDPACENAEKEITRRSLNGAEVCVDFTRPDVALENVAKIAALGANIVVGTTGWLRSVDEVKALVERHDIGLVWSPNFSVGVNAFLKIVAEAAGLFNKLVEYDVMGVEFHHRGKADAPSGTAERIGKVILQNMPRKKCVVADRPERQLAPEAIHLASVRGGSIPGIHSVLFDGPCDTIELTHTARNREGFAAGAVTAVEFIQGRKGFYDMDDMMCELLGGCKNV